MKPRSWFGVVVALSSSGCTSDQALFWTIFLLFGGFALGFALIYGVLKLIGKVLESISGQLSELLRRHPLGSSHAGPQGFAVTGSDLYIRRPEVWIGEDDFFSWSFSMANPGNLSIEIRSELYADATLVSHKEEVTSGSVRGFAIGHSMIWPDPGTKVIRGRTTFSVNGQPVGTAELTGRVLVRAEGR